jgi:hypothetical protein
MPKPSIALYKVMGVRETGEPPLLTGGGLYQDEELWPEQEQRQLMKTGGTTRLLEGRKVHKAHGRPSLPSRQT